MSIYVWALTGTDGNGNRWETSGEVDKAVFHDALDDAQRLSFHQLVQGKAKFGNPGVGCSGSYRIDSLTINRKEEEL